MIHGVPLGFSSAGGLTHAKRQLAAQGDTFVTVISSDPGALVVPSGGVVVPNGQTSADVLVSVVGGGATVPLTFTFGASATNATIVTGT